MKSKRPNVLIYVSHDTGRYLGCYGKPTLQTPSLDAFAKQGFQFNNAFSTAPLCSPSRASLFTGLYPHQCGVNGLVDERCLWDLQPKDGHLVSILKQVGYTTCLAGFIHETRDCQTLPFDDYIGGVEPLQNGGLSIGEIAEEVEDWLDRREGDQPFYLQMGSHETHRSFSKFGASPFDEKGRLSFPHLHEGEELTNDISEFQGSVKEIDAALGQILNALRERNLEQDTLVIFTTDHGIDFPGLKGTFRDDGLETFLLMRYPSGGWEAGKKSETLVSNINIIPTILEILDLGSPYSLPGKSLVPLLKGEEGDDSFRYIFAEKTFHDCYDPTRCVRTGRYKYTLYFEKSILADLRLGTMERSFWLKDGITRNADEELYDLEVDPEEQQNLVNDPSKKHLLQELRQVLFNNMKALNDPLLKGPISSPRYGEAMDSLISRMGSELEGTVDKRSAET